MTKQQPDQEETSGQPRQGQDRQGKGRQGQQTEERQGKERQGQGQERQGQERQPDGGGQHHDEDKTRREQNDPERGSGRQGRNS